MIRYRSDMRSTTCGYLLAAEDGLASDQVSATIPARRTGRRRHSHALIDIAPDEKRIALSSPPRIDAVEPACTGRAIPRSRDMNAVASQAPMQTMEVMKIKEHIGAIVTGIDLAQPVDAHTQK